MNSFSWGLYVRMRSEALDRQFEGELGTDPTRTAKFDPNAEKMVNIVVEELGEAEEWDPQGCSSEISEYLKLKTIFPDRRTTRI